MTSCNQMTPLPNFSFLNSALGADFTYSLERGADLLTNLECVCVCVYKSSVLCAQAILNDPISTPSVLSLTRIWVPQCEGNVEGLGFSH